MSGPQPSRTDLVIAIGNPLRGDDGVAWRLTEPLRRRPRPGVRLRQCQQLTPELAAELVGVRRLLLLDGWWAPAAAGPCLQAIGGGGGNGGDIAGSHPAHGPASGAPAANGPPVAAGDSHFTALADVLRLAEWLYGAHPQAWQLLVPVHRCPHGPWLSRAMVRQLPAARRLLRHWLAGGGDA